MKRMITVGMALILMMSCVVLVACGGGDDDGTATATAQPTEADTPVTPSSDGTETAAPATPDETGGEIGDLFAEIADKAKDLKCFHFKVVATVPGEADAGYEIWMNDDGKMKMEGDVGGEGEGMMLMDGEAMYMYDAETGQAMKFPMDGPDASSAPIQQNPVDNIEEILGFGYTVDGEEEINGMDCIVVNYSDMGADMTMYIWKDYGFPVKTVIDGPTGEMVTEYKEIDFDCADDDEFQLPAGAEVMDLEDMMGGFGDLVGDIDPDDFEIPDFSGM